MGALLALGVSMSARAQAPSWQAGAAISGSTGTTTVDATAPDANGNLYVTGSFRGTATFGTTTLTSAGNADVYVAKWSAATNSFAWAMRMGSAASDYTHGIAVSGSSVYVGGDFSGPTATVGGITLTNASTSGSSDVFVAKLIDAGSTSSVAWATRAGGTGSETMFRIVANGTSVYLDGIYNGAPAVFGATSLPTAGSSDLFVAKITDGGTTGTVSWALGAGGTGSDEVYGLAVSGASVYVCGAETSPSLVFGGTTLTGAGDYDGFIAKITDAGATASYAWAQRVGGAGSEGFANVVVNGSNVYAAGAFTSATLAVGSTTLATAGNNDALLVKLTDAASTSSFNWAQRGGGPGDDIAYGLTERNGDVYIAGFFGAFSSSGGTLAATFGAQTLTSVGGADVFVSRVRDSGAAGTFNYTQQAGGPGDDIAYAAAISANRLYVGGTFTGASVTFGSVTLTNTTFAETGFLAYLNDPILATAPAAQLPGLALYPNPARATTTVQLPASQAAAQATLTLFDALGRPVRTATVPTGQDYPLDLAGLASGLYALRMRVGEEATATRQLVIE